MFFFKNISMADYEKTFFDFKIESISGEINYFNEYKDKAVLLVNTASYCGFTKQYADLQHLWEKYQAKGLIVFGIPVNEVAEVIPESLKVRGLNIAFRFDKLYLTVTLVVKPGFTFMNTVSLFFKP